MRLDDIKYRLGEFWNDFRKETAGLVGLGILAVAIIIMMFEPVIIPYKEASTRWRDISYWQDNAANAAPSWTNIFAAKKSAVTTRLKPNSVSRSDTSPEVVYEFDYECNYDIGPTDLIVRGEASGTVPLSVTIVRPDGQEIEIVRKVFEGLSDDIFRASFSNEGRSNLTEYIQRLQSERENIPFIGDASVTQVLFSSFDGSDYTRAPVAKGKYVIKARTLEMEGLASINSIELVVVGKVSGLMGTDNSKRDLFSGVIAGLKWAMFIGLLTSVVSVLIGVFYGIIAAYFGGMVDSVMMLIFDYFISLPVLPILIVFSAVYKPSIWTIIGALILFSWVGPVKTIRSMALQIKEETYIESAKALGAGHWRIIFNHMAPLLIPYSFASMALAVPGAIVYESSVSLLGLGDATIVTWGQILHDALSGGAVLNGLWWWVLPPGLLIAILGMTFAFIGFSMDKILHPKLRTR